MDPDDDDEPDDDLDNGENEEIFACPHCAGTGWQSDGRVAVECAECGGSGVC